MPIYNAYTKTNDMPVITDFPNWTSTNPMLKSQAMHDFGTAYNLWAIKHQIPQSVLDAWYAANLANQPQAQQNSWWQNASNAISNAWQNSTVGQNVIAASTSISNAWQGSMAGQLAIQAQNNFNAFLSKITDKDGNLTILALLPFKPLMVAALKARGVKVTSKDSLTMIAVMFNDVVVNNKHSFEYAHYDRLNHFGEEGSGFPAGGEGGGDSAEAMAASIAAQAAASLGKEAIKALVSGISNFIKRIFDKKAKGETLTNEEEKIMTDASAAMVNVATGGDTSAGDTDWTPLLKFLGWVGAAFTVVKVIKLVRGKATV